MCDPNSSTPKYCHALRECVTSSTGCGSPQNLTVGEIEFYAPASKPVFCASVERFMEDDNTTCPSPPVFTAPKADYELLYEFTDCAWTLGK